MADTNDEKNTDSTSSLVTLAGLNTAYGTLCGYMKEDYEALQGEITTAINNLNATVRGSLNNDDTVISGKKVGVKVVEEAGKLSSVLVVENDIASASLLGAKTDTSSAETAFGYIAKEASNRDTAITEAINKLNHTSTGAARSYIQKVSETNGVIAETVVEFDTTVDSTSTDNNAPTSKAVKTYADSVASTAETTAEGYTDTKITDLNASITSSDGSKVTVKVTEADGKITAVNVTESDIASADTSVTHAKNTRVGSSSVPVYVDSDGSAKEISSIILGGETITTNVATFTSKGNTSSDSSTVIIDGPDVDSSVTIGGESLSALLVKGGIVATSGISAKKVYHAVWNDISDAIEVQDGLDIQPGKCYYFNGKEYHKTTKYCQKGIIGIHSDTAGSMLGKKGKHLELDISIGGFVLAYVDREYSVGTPLTCANHGYLTKMNLKERILHPERLVGTYWKNEASETWGDDNHQVIVDGRKWIKIK